MKKRSIEVNSNYFNLLEAKTTKERFFYAAQMNPYLKDYLNTVDCFSFLDTYFITNEAYIIGQLITLKVNDTKKNTGEYQATYSITTNEINLYYKTKLEDVIGHELFHLLSGDKARNKCGLKNKKSKMGVFLNEGITELLSLEFFEHRKEKINIYETEVCFVRLLCESMPSEVLIDYYLNHTFDEFCMYLEQTFHVSKVRQIFSALDSIRNYRSVIDTLERKYTTYRLSYTEEYMSACLTYQHIMDTACEMCEQIYKVTHLEDPSTNLLFQNYKNRLMVTKGKLDWNKGFIKEQRVKQDSITTPFYCNIQKREKELILN